MSQNIDYNLSNIIIISCLTIDNFDILVYSDDSKLKIWREIKLPIIIVKGWTFPEDELSSKAVIEMVQKATKEVFGKDGICPIIPGEITIVPGLESVSVRLALTEPVIEIYLYEGEERTPEFLDQIKIEFEKEMDNRFSVVVSAQPKDLFIIM